MQNKKAYSEDWNDIIRPAILKRDAYKCTVCKVGHKRYIAYRDGYLWRYIESDEVAEFKENGWKAYRVYLQVAHLDHNKNNNAEINLRTLCPYHHLANDATYKRLARLMR
jgi:hypothetical protein